MLVVRGFVLRIVFIIFRRVPYQKFTQIDVSIDFSVFELRLQPSTQKAFKLLEESIGAHYMGVGTGHIPTLACSCKIVAQLDGTGLALAPFWGTFTYRALAFEALSATSALRSALKRPGEPL